MNLSTSPSSTLSVSKTLPAKLHDRKGPELQDRSSEELQ